MLDLKQTWNNSCRYGIWSMFCYAQLLFGFWSNTKKDESWAGNRYWYCAMQHCPHLQYAKGWLLMKYLWKCMWYTSYDFVEGRCCRTLGLVAEH